MYRDRGASRNGMCNIQYYDVLLFCFGYMKDMKLLARATKFRIYVTCKNVIRYNKKTWTEQRSP